jgi:hypothetical protein
MASTSETGHARNVANFERLIAICNGYGPKYNPSNPALQIVALQDTLTKSRTCLGDVNAQIAAYKKAIGARQVCYNTLRPLATRVLNALIASDAPDKAKEDCRALNRRIQGVRAGSSKAAPKPADDNAAAAETEPNAKSISTSRQSFDLLAEHFSGIIALLESEAAYKPNEKDLQLAALKTCHSDIAKANAAAATAAVNLDNARILRNSVMYGDKTGLYALAASVKTYAKSVFGASSPEYRQIGGLKFVKVK